MSEPASPDPGAVLRLLLELERGAEPIRGRLGTGTENGVAFNGLLELVHLLDEHEKKIKYQIVGETEADARVGRISYASPLGRALIGRSKGDEIEFSAPSGDKYFEIAKIEFI